MEEVTGLHVKVILKIADVHFNVNLQPYFLVEKVSVEYGTGIGEEFGEYDPMFGTYHPMWMPVADILDHPVVPRPLAEVVLRSAQSGWPNEPVVIFDS